MKHLVRDGVKLAYEDVGSGAPPFVMIHGWTCNHSYFAPQRDHYAKNHRVISVDLRGHGESDTPQQKYTITGFADDVAWMCRELKLPKAVVIGHSMGGMVALELAASHPELFSAAVACDSPIVVPEATKGNFTVVREEFSKPEWRTFQRNFIANALFIAADDPKRKEEILKDMTSAPDHVTRECFEAIATADSEGAAKRCKIPFLHIVTANPPCDTAKLRELCPTAQIGMTVGAGHFHQLEVPGQVNAMLDRFLTVAHVI